MFVISRDKSGRPRISVQCAPGDECSLQFRYWLRGLLRNVEVIDAEGKHFSEVQTEVIGVDWQLYRRFGIAVLVFLPIILLIEIAFMSFMTRFRLIFTSPPVTLSLPEVSEKVASMVRENPDFYTFAPPEDIIRRLKRAHSVEALINGFIHD